MAPRTKRPTQAAMAENPLLSKLKDEAMAELTPLKKALQERNLSLENEVGKLTAQVNAIKLEKEDMAAKLEAEAQEKEALEAKLKKLGKSSKAAFQPKLDAVLAMSNLETAEKEKKKRDPRQPKKPATAFLLWCSEERAQMTKENAEAGKNIIDCSKELGAKWKTLAAAQRKPYEERYKIAKEDYDKLNEKYKKELAEEKKTTGALDLLHKQREQEAAMELLKQYMDHQKEVEEGSKAKKKVKDTDKPKRATTAFIYFSNERRGQITELEKLSMPEVAKRLGAEWRELSEEDKKPYEEKAEEDKKRYQQEMEGYTQKKQVEQEASKEEAASKAKKEKLEAMNLLKAEEKKGQAMAIFKQIQKDEKEKKKEERGKKKEEREKKAAMKDPNKPKRPMSAYLLYSQAVRAETKEENPEANFGAIAGLISAKWKGLSASEKAPFEAEASKLKAGYNDEMTSYNASLAPGSPQ